ncbi:splicing factor, suppressor of white-apricot homolog isoform X3 [Ischnura elegans]|uniref:splicing factor, suppressor of white-apricot homolog isoform X3 n=1 Tax=Ischnura elegans TaxID=197161 RepID=UPI001ED8847B|nr:splicing factor, suppressor of white-apricot homolog isoform X3 [Ischnura elegans]
MAVPRQNWQLNDAGILRKKEEDEELLVFGYSCKIFRDDEKALFIDQGKHLIPWMGDETLKIDRYDGRAALADLRESEAPIGGYDLWASLSDAERRVEQLCDEERYRALTHNEEEEALYQEEELKRLQQALSAENTYGQVAYQYDESGQPVGEHKAEGSAGPGGAVTEEDEPFVPPQELDIPLNMVLPETVKSNAIIEKTAMFINEQGAQMEILLKMKQAKNPQFQFLSFDDPLHSYYRHLLMAIKTGRYRPKPPKEEEEDEGEQDDEDDGYYLHPSLASSASRIELAPSIPSINYKPSADCAYSMLVNKIRDKQAAFVTTEETPVATAVTAVKPVSSAVQSDQESAEEEDVEEDGEVTGYGTYKGSREELPMARGGKGDPATGGPAVGAGRKRRKRRGARRKRRSSGGGDKGDFASGATAAAAPIVEPPPEMQIVIDKMASYVAKNGRDFETIVKSKGDPRFSFLETSHHFNSYYILRLQQYELQNAPQLIIQDIQQPSPAKKSRNGPVKAVSEDHKDEKPSEKSKPAPLEKESSKSATKLAPVCFSIKKPKEVEILPLEKRSALLLEESSEEGEGEEDGEGRGDQAGEEFDSKTWTKQSSLDKTDQLQPQVEAEEESANINFCQDIVIATEVQKEPVVVEMVPEKQERDLVESAVRSEIVKVEAPRIELEPSPAPAVEVVAPRDSNLTPPGIEDIEVDKDPFLEFGDSNSPGGLSPASAASRERQLQQERKRKAAIFLRMIKKEHPPESIAKPLQKTDTTSKTNTTIETIIVEDDDSYPSIPSPPIIGTLRKPNIPAPPLIRKEEWKFSSTAGGGHNGVSSHAKHEKSYRKVYSVESDGQEEPTVFHHRHHHHHHRPHKHKHKHRKESSPLSPSAVYKRSRSSSHRHSSIQGHHRHHKKSKHHGRHKEYRRYREDVDVSEEHQSRRYRSRSRESRYTEKPERRKVLDDVVEEVPVSKVEKKRDEDSSSSEGETSGSESSDSRDSGR